jgi:hypothetical protein
VIEAMERGTDALAKFSFASGIGAKARDRLAPLMFGIDAVRTKFAHEISMLQVKYDSSPIVQDNGRGRRGKPGAGQVVVDAGSLRDSSGAELGWLDVVRGTSHLVVAFAGTHPPERFAEAVHTLAAGYSGPVRAKVVVPGERLPAELQDGEVVLDQLGEAHQRFAMRDGGIVVVRPDKYLAAVHKGLDPAAAGSVLAMTLGRPRVAV